MGEPECVSVAGIGAGVGDEAGQKVFHRIQGGAPLKVREVREVREYWLDPIAHRASPRPVAAFCDSIHAVTSAWS